MAGMALALSLKEGKATGDPMDSLGLLQHLEQAERDLAEATAIAGRIRYAFLKSRAPKSRFKRSGTLNSRHTRVPLNLVKPHVFMPRLTSLIWVNSSL